MPHDLVHSAMGISRTHEIVFWFGLPQSMPVASMLADSFSTTLAPFVSPEWNVLTGVLGRQGLPDADPEVDSILQRMFDLQAQAIEEGGWYGLLTYGIVRYGWNKTRGSWMKYNPKFSWYNAGHMMNGGTLTEALWQTYLRTGNPRAYEVAQARSRQDMDLATIHFHDDTNWIGARLRHGGPDPWTGHRKSHGGHHPLAGLPLCYYVTGYERAAEVAHLIGRTNYRHRQPKRISVDDCSPIRVAVFGRDSSRCCDGAFL